MVVDDFITSSFHTYKLCWKLKYSGSQYYSIFQSALIIPPFLSLLTFIPQPAVTVFKWLHPILNILNYSVIFLGIPRITGLFDLYVNILPGTFLVFIIVTHCLSLILYWKFVAIAITIFFVGHLLVIALEHVSPMELSSVF